MSERRTILKFAAGTVFSGNGDTATNLTAVTPAPAFTVDQLFPLPGVIGWAEQSGLQLDYNLTGFSGTNPTIQFYVDVLGADGVYYQIYQTPTISATGQGTVSIGAGLGVAQIIGVQGRVRWAVGGTASPAVTGSLSLLGV